MSQLSQAQQMMVLMTGRLPTTRDGSNVSLLLANNKPQKESTSELRILGEILQSEARRLDGRRMRKRVVINSAKSRADSVKYRLKAKLAKRKAKK